MDWYCFAHFHPLLFSCIRCFSELNTVKFSVFLKNLSNNSNFLFLIFIFQDIFLGTHNFWTLPFCSIFSGINDHIFPHKLPPQHPQPHNLKESLDMQILFLSFVIAKFHPNPCQFSAWWKVSVEMKPEHSKFWEPLYLTVYFKIWTCSLKRTPKTKTPKMYCELFHQYC